MKGKKSSSAELKATRVLTQYIIYSFIILLLISISAGYFLFIRKVLMFENMLEVDRKERVQRSIVSMQDYLIKTCEDWSFWDEAWAFMKDENPAFVESNLSLETLVTLDLNLMSFVREDRSVKWQMTVDLEEEEQVISGDFPEDVFSERLFSFALSDSPLGLIAVGPRVYMVVARPITPGSDSEDSAGYFILGREMTDPVIANLSAMINVEFQILSREDITRIPSIGNTQLLEDGHLVEREKNLITSYCMLPCDTPAVPYDILIIIRHNRDLMQLGWKTFFLYLAIIIAGVLLVAFGDLKFMNHHYFLPVKNLYRNVVRIKEEGDLTFRIPVGSDDEFGRLCESFNGLLDVIQIQTHELSSKNRDLHNQVNSDELTGLYNKRFIRNWQESMQSDPSGKAVKNGAFIMLDIDHFKLYNDRYGHLAGDVCLREVAGVLKSVVTRGTDFPCRYGGEEFLVILEKTDCLGAVRVAEKIMKDIERLAIEHGDSPTSPILTVSIGISCGSFALSPEDLDKLISTADEALYESKKAGRNRYTVRDGCLNLDE